MALSDDDWRVDAEALRTSAQYRTKDFAPLALGCLAAAGRLGGVALGDEVGLSATEDDDGDGSGFGLAAGSGHPAVPTPTSSASAATERTARECDTFATPRESRLRRGERPPQLLQPTQARTSWRPLKRDLWRTPKEELSADVDTVHQPVVARPHHDQP